MGNMTGESLGLVRTSPKRKPSPYELLHYLFQCVVNQLFLIIEVELHVEIEDGPNSSLDAGYGCVYKSSCARWRKLVLVSLNVVRVLDAV